MDNKKTDNIQNEAEVICPQCNGRTKVPCPNCGSGGCRTCWGKGWFTCPRCQGRGMIPKEPDKFRVPILCIEVYFGEE